MPTHRACFTSRCLTAFVWEPSLVCPWLPTPVGGCDRSRRWPVYSPAQTPSALTSCSAGLEHFTPWLGVNTPTCSTWLGRAQSLTLLPFEGKVIDLSPLPGSGPQQKLSLQRALQLTQRTGTRTLRGYPIWRAWPVLAALTTTTTKTKTRTPTPTPAPAKTAIPLMIPAIPFLW